MAKQPLVPFSEPPWLAGLPSPYFTPEHKKWQEACRKFITANLHDHAFEWEESDVPEHVFDTFAKAHMLIPTLPSPLPVQALKENGIHDILGVVKVEDFTYFHSAFPIRYSHALGDYVTD